MERAAISFCDVFSMSMHFSSISAVCESRNKLKLKTFSSLFNNKDQNLLENYASMSHVPETPPRVDLKIKRQFHELDRQ